MLFGAHWSAWMIITLLFYVIWLIAMQSSRQQQMAQARDKKHLALFERLEQLEHESRDIKELARDIRDDLRLLRMK